MSDLFHELSDWLAGVADSDWAIAVLGLASFIEAIFFPIPPDPLMLGIAVLRPGISIWLGVWVTATSVLGALVGYWVGKKLGRPVLLKFFSESKISKVEALYQKYGMWATLIAAFTPIPYKVFAITAGVLRLDRRTFVIASIIGRGARFITLGVLIYFFGESIEKFVIDNFEILTVAVTVLVLALAAAYVLFSRRGKANKRKAEEAAAHGAPASGQTTEPG
ncbi:MAG: DedA family protein [SAR202 cluster bacterium]|nr:DedA family protein [SAR202 cluster bacterium]